jgi:hypothetical protein
MNLLIKYVSKKDDLKLKKFYCEAYGIKHILNNIKHHNWQFKKNPFNKSNSKTIGVIEEVNTIYSHMGFMPIELKVYDSIKNAIWHMSFFTLPSHRGRRYGKKLIQFTEKQKEYSLVLGGSEGTNKIYKEMGGINFGNLNRYILILNKEKVEKFLNKKIRIKKIKFMRSELEFSKIKKIDNGYEKFWDKVKERYPITVNRTKDYLEWRYFNHPLIDYDIFVLKNKNELCGFLVLRFENNNKKLKIGRIIDMMVFKQFETQLLKETINFCKNKVDIIDFFCTGNFYKNSLLKEKFMNDPNGKLKIPFLFNPIDVKQIRGINLLFKKNEKNKSIEKINDMYFVKGDSDQDRAN